MFESKIWWNFLYINLTLISLNFLPIDVSSFRQTTFRIGLQTLKNPDSVHIQTHKKGLLKADRIYFAYHAGNEFDIVWDTELLVLKYKNSTLGKYHKITFLNGDSILELNSAKGAQRKIDGYLELYAQGGIKAISILPEDKYLTDVLCTEAGMGQPQEYYRVQAIISRTYAYNNALRHIRHGYNFCDKQHCQVYKGFCDNKAAKNSVIASRGLVITDKKNKLITSAYHANCGGKTCNSEDIWGAERSYLKAIHDQFCTSSSKAEWTYTMNRSTWIQYLEKNSGQHIDPLTSNFTTDNLSGTAIYHFKNVSLSYTKIKDDFNLKSNWFSIEDKGNELIFTGRGMGHRVGLCQQGAKLMTMNGFNYKEVIGKYYSETQIKNYKDLIMKNISN